MSRKHVCLKYGSSLPPWIKLAPHVSFLKCYLYNDGILKNGAYISASHYKGVIMGAMTSKITSLIIVYSTVYWGADQRKHQSSASLAFVCGIHRGPVNSPHKWPVTLKMFSFNDVISWSDHVNKLSPGDEYTLQSTQTSFITSSGNGLMLN